MAEARIIVDLQRNPDNIQHVLTCSERMLTEGKSATEAAAILTRYIDGECDHAPPSLSSPATHSPPAQCAGPAATRHIARGVS